MTDELYELIYHAPLASAKANSEEDFLPSLSSRCPNILPPNIQHVSWGGSKPSARAKLPPYEGWRLEGFMVRFSTIKRIFVGHWVMLLAAAGKPLPSEITMSTLANAVAELDTENS